MGEQRTVYGKIAVQFAREVVKGGYKIVSTEELKGWIDQKKDNSPPGGKGLIFLTSRYTSFLTSSVLSSVKHIAL